MLSAIQQFFSAHLTSTSTKASSPPDHNIRLAVAALLIEIAESDYQESSEEKQALLSIVSRHFNLSKEEASTLISHAKTEKSYSTDNFQFTRLINQHYQPAQKIRLIEDLWKVALADGELHKYEEHLIRRLADLLHLSHREFIAAKLRVTEQQD